MATTKLGSNNHVTLIVSSKKTMLRYDYGTSMRLTIIRIDIIMYSQ